MTAKGNSVSFWSCEHFLKLIVVIGAQLCEYEKDKEIITLAEYSECIVYDSA